MSKKVSTPSPQEGIAMTGERKRQRRKQARPAEIIEAAQNVFLSHGYGASKMEDVAKAAGIAKGTIFIYFPTKPDLFRAVAHAALETNLPNLQAASSDINLPARDIIPAILRQIANAGDSKISAIGRLLLAEARAFPDLAQIWHDEVLSKVLGLISGIIERGQARGEIRAGDPTLYAFSLFGPMLSALLFRHVFSSTGTPLPDLKVLAEQHAQVILDGLAITRTDP